MRGDHPVLSILTPSYNYGHYIRDAIASVQSQGILGVEHIVVDGASTDETVNVLQSHDRVTWVSEPDTGQSDALNKGLGMSTAPIIGWLNADEFYLRDSLECVLEIFRDPSVDVVYGDCFFVDKNGELIRLLAQHRYSEYVLRSYGPFIPSCAAFFRRRVLGESPWNIQSRRIMDWDLYLRLAEAGARFRYIARPLAAFRVHENRVTVTRSHGLSSEHLRIRRRHGLPLTTAGHLTTAFLGHLAHAGLKMRDGSYLRQYIANRSVGTDMRWWANSHTGQTSIDPDDGLFGTPR